MFPAVAANFHELRCTAGFLMVYTRLPTLAGRYGWLAAYNLIYILPLAVTWLAARLSRRAM